MQRTATADPARASRRLDLLARRNQLEVMLAALLRNQPDLAEPGPPRSAAVERARQRWGRIQEDLAAVEAALLHEG